MRSATNNFINNIFTLSATSMKPNQYITHWMQYCQNPKLPNWC